MTLLGALIFSNNAKIDATAALSVIEFKGTAAQVVPSGAFTGNSIDGFHLNNASGLTVNDDITIANPFTLTTGTLIIGARTLTLNGIVAVTSGTIAAGSSRKYHYWRNRGS